MLCVYGDQDRDVFRLRSFRKSHGRRLINRIMGGGSLGSKRTLEEGSGHSKGKCTTSPGFLIELRASSVARSTLRCPSASPGCPRVRPSGYSTPATRGTLTDAVRSGIEDSVIVEIPAASNSRCASPTDQQHTVHIGINVTASTDSSFRR